MHHNRRKSGHGSTNSSTTDVRKVMTTSDLTKSRRPQTLVRKSTPQTAQKLGKNPRDREREWEEERWVEDERESFPQFCMTCEKQFTPQDEKFLYCSEACRERDQNVSVRASSSHASARGHDSFGGSTLVYPAGSEEPRDIIPRASPSRWSPPTTPASGQHTGGQYTNGQYTSAVSALRSLSIRPVSPTSPMAGSAMWSFARSALASPSTSYTKTSPSFYPSTYDNGYIVTGYKYGQGGGTTSDRPLPARRPGAYSRPKSIELVTPIVGR
ncbi:hypothetical protein GGS23DRAFT_8567 [Durotheca rogersii]|uniref:uncharacterized protein n=1 Tax=Durotheca rogersii TaxID=419775 RepID=UPI00221EEDA9|nr:uncharacterized protein GGS23DRAFT_8567 [Durotheca rogersii]KAI5868042.1 hypothetical protein GGS23DRAFT_8567 [Durotheca rogersii]